MSEAALVSIGEGAGNFQVTKPRDLKILDPKTTVHFLRVSGEPATSELGISPTWTTNSIEDVQDISMATAGLISHHMSIPCDCVSLIWGTPLNHQVNVTVVLTPLPDEILEAYHQASGQYNPGPGRTHVEQPICMVCCQYCHDADRDCSREYNCVECFPCFLCDRCSITMENGNPRCYFCLTPEDWPFVKEHYPEDSLRIQLLTPESFGPDTAPCLTPLD